MNLSTFVHNCKMRTSTKCKLQNLKFDHGRFLHTWVSCPPLFGERNVFAPTWTPCESFQLDSYKFRHSWIAFPLHITSCSAVWKFESLICIVQGLIVSLASVVAAGSLLHINFVLCQGLFDGARVHFHFEEKKKTVLMWNAVPAR